MQFSALLSLEGIKSAVKDSMPYFDTDDIDAPGASNKFSALADVIDSTPAAAIIELKKRCIGSDVSDLIIAVKFQAVVVSVFKLAAELKFDDEDDHCVNDMLAAAFSSKKMINEALLRLNR